MKRSKQSSSKLASGTATKVKSMQDQQKTWLQQREKALGKTYQTSPEANSLAPKQSAVHIAKKGGGGGSAGHQMAARLSYLPEKYESHKQQRQDPPPPTSILPPHHSTHLSYQRHPETNIVSSRSSSARSLSPEEFDAVADNIITRVKNQLHLPPGGRGAGEEGSVPESHLCPVCNRPMSGEPHVPMLIIPCGHTVCRECGETKAGCFNCGGKITGLARNTALQQIIQGCRRAKADRQHSNGYAQNNSEEHARKAESLRLRLEVLRAEETQLKADLNLVSGDVSSAQKEVTFIEDEVKVTEEELDRLQERLVHLAEDKQTANAKEEAARGRYHAVASKVALLQETFHDLEEELRKEESLAGIT